MPTALKGGRFLMSEVPLYAAAQLLCTRRETCVDWQGLHGIMDTLCPLGGHMLLQG